MVPKSEDAAADDALARGVLDALEDALLALDGDGVVRLANPAAEELLETPAAALGGRDLRGFGPGGERLHELASRAVSERRAVHDEAIPWPRRFGGPRWLEARAAPRLRERAIDGATLVLRERPAAFGLAGEASGAPERLYATMAAGFAHEVRNPLGGIRGAIQLLDADLPVASPLREHARVALREVQRLASLVERLLDLGRPPVRERAAVDLHALLDEVIASAERDPASRGLAFERRYDASLPPVVGDGPSLGRLFHNLVRNAAEATAGAGHVRISTGVETGVRLRASPGAPAPSGLVRVHVSDDGPGVPAELLPRLFLPFATGKPKGTGLGLALAQKVALDHGGWIALTSPPGAPATFTVYLPAAPGGPS